MESLGQRAMVAMLLACGFYILVALVSAGLVVGAIEAWSHDWDFRIPLVLVMLATVIIGASYPTAAPTGT